MPAQPPPMIATRIGVWSPPFLRARRFIDPNGIRLPYLRSAAQGAPSRAAEREGRGAEERGRPGGRGVAVVAGDGAAAAARLPVSAAALTAVRAAGAAGLPT